MPYNYIQMITLGNIKFGAWYIWPFCGYILFAGFERAFNFFFISSGLVKRADGKNVR